jgi:hypothetical protein
LDLEAKPFNPSATVTGTIETTPITPTAVSIYSSYDPISNSEIRTNIEGIHVENDNDVSNDDTSATWKNVKTPLKSEISADNVDQGSLTEKNLIDINPVHTQVDNDSKDRGIENDTIVGSIKDSVQEIVQVFSFTYALLAGLRFTCRG